jgi:hypothetical protein
MNRLIEIFFGPKMGSIPEYREYAPAADQHLGMLLSSIGKPRPKKYRDAIARHWAEHSYWK